MSLLTFKPGKTYQSVVFASPALSGGMSCSAYCGGSATGALKDGVYTDGQYTPGSKLSTVTLSGIVTTIGSSGGMGGGFPRR